ncbi:MAG: PfkB family carbohydrate kinase [Candidatus Hodarchaeota archaeon]
MVNGFDIVFFGHMAIDTVIYLEKGEKNIQKISAGGAVTFGSFAAKTCNPSLRVGIGSKVGRDLPDHFLEPFKEKGIDLRGIKLDEERPSTRFELLYDGPKRTLSCPNCCSNLVLEDQPKVFFSSKIFHLGPLCREITPAFIEGLGAAGINQKHVGIDLQGFIRDINDDGSISFINSKDGFKILDLLHDTFGDKLIIKADDVESQSISNIEDPLENMEYFMDQFNDATILITSGRNGSLLGCGNNGKKVERIPAFKPEAIVDETGAGDTFLAAFLAILLEKDSTFKATREAAYFASSASSFLVEGKGIKGLQSKNIILERVNNGVYFTK